MLSLQVKFVTGGQADGQTDNGKTISLPPPPPCFDAGNQIQFNQFIALYYLFSNKISFFRTT